MFLDDPWQVPNITANGSTGQRSGGIDFIGESQEAIVGTVRLGNIGDHEGSRVQAALVVGALEILSAQHPHSPVVSPEKEGNDDSEGPRAHDLTPDRGGIRDIEWGHGTECRQSRGVAVILTLGDVHRYHDEAADDAEEDEDIAEHLGEAQEDSGVQPDGLDQLRLTSVDHRFDPGKEALAHRGRGVFLVCMFDLGRIDERVTRSEEREEEGKHNRDAYRGAQRGPDGADSELSKEMLERSLAKMSGFNVQQIEKDPQ